MNNTDSTPRDTAVSAAVLACLSNPITDYYVIWYISRLYCSKIVHLKDERDGLLIHRHDISETGRRSFNACLERHGTNDLDKVPREEADPIRNIENKVKIMDRKVEKVKREHKKATEVRNEYIGILVGGVSEFNRTSERKVNVTVIMEDGKEVKSKMWTEGEVAEARTEAGPGLGASDTLQQHPSVPTNTTSSPQTDPVTLAVLALLSFPVTNLYTMIYISELYSAQVTHLIHQLNELSAQAHRSEEVELVATTAEELSTLRERLEEVEGEYKKIEGKRQQYMTILIRAVDGYNRTAPDESKIQYRLIPMTENKARPCHWAYTEAGPRPGSPHAIR